MSPSRPAPGANAGEELEIVGVTESPEPPAAGSRPGDERPVRPDRGAAAFVWGTWILLLLASLAYVGKFGSPLPYCETWEDVPWIAGEKPVTLGYLWEQTHEHRLFLHRAVLISLLRLSGGDHRVVMLFFVFALGGLSFALIRVARGLRGRTRYADAFLPLALLQLGMSYSALWVAAICNYFLPSILVIVLLMIITKKGLHLTLGTAVLAGLCLTLLPLGGAPGLLYAPFFVLWLACSALVAWRSARPHGRRDGVVMLAFVLAALLVVLLYFVGFDRSRLSKGATERTPLWAAFECGLAFLASFAPGVAVSAWPYSGYALFAMMFALMALGAGSLVAVARRERGPDRSRAAGLLFFASAVALFAAALGWGRAMHGPKSCVLTYELFQVPALCYIYFAWMIGDSNAANRKMQKFLFFFMCCVVPVNVLALRLPEARSLGWKTRLFVQDLRDGVPPYLLIARHYDAFNIVWKNDDSINDYMHILKRHDVGPFRDLRQDPPLRWLALPLDPVEVNDAKWVGGLVSGKDYDSTVTFALPRPMHVAGIRVDYDYLNDKKEPIRLSDNNSGFWIDYSMQAADPNHKKSYRDYFRFYKNKCLPTYRTMWQLSGPMVVYIDDTIDHIRLHPGSRPYSVRISRIEVLVPEDR